MKELFPLGFEPLERDWPTRKMYNDWIKTYTKKKKDEVRNGYAIEGNYGSKLSTRDLKCVRDFDILFDAVLNNLDGTNRDTSLHYFASQRNKHRNISNSYFIWCCEIICIKNDLIKKFGK